MRTNARNEQGSFDLAQPGRTPEEELWKALEWMRRSGIGFLIEAYREASTVYGRLGRGPIAIEFPEHAHEIRLQHEALDRGEQIRGKLGDPMWTNAIELFRGAHELYRPLIDRARAALPRVSQTMDDPSVPVPQRFTARVVVLVDHLDAALPTWYRRPDQRPGDEYLERFRGFPDPSGLKELIPELSEVLHLLRGVWGVEREPPKLHEDDLRPAKWFSDATDEAIYPDLLRRAQSDGRLKRSKKVARRWHHSIREVAKFYPEYAATLHKANESAPGVTGAHASPKSG